VAGYLFNLDNETSLKFYIRNGIYSTKLSPPTNNRWLKHHEATFADYITMKTGDNVYFFIKRGIYGIGELINVGKTCKYCNYPDASHPNNPKYENLKEQLILDEGQFSNNQRWICLFKPSPYFFKKGIDMDDVLSSNPELFKMLRAFWKVSFIKFDEKENQAFKDIILKTNQEYLESIGKEAIYPTEHDNFHAYIKNDKNLTNYAINAFPILVSCASAEALKHEMAIEAGLLYQLCQQDPKTVSIFGIWDYLSHQVIASPFKPIDYMDKMDIFGYSFISGFTPTISKYLVIEIKKDDATHDDIEQLLKYVDWVKDEYCYGDYSMIKAFLVAYEISNGIFKHKKRVANRQYTIGRRPAISTIWNDLKLVRYRFNKDEKKIVFSLADEQYED